ncbi:succinylglutamate desuccinylase [Pseudomaricurvus sp. HS19]|nr:succinylglutamate desuccinylase [Pseudomaricurvus sp. HS19]
MLGVILAGCAGTQSTLAEETVAATELPAIAAVAAAASGDAQVNASDSNRPAQAKSVPLDEPVTERSPEPSFVAKERPPEVAEQVPAGDDATDSVASDTPVEANQPQPLLILNTEVPPATTTRLSWSPSQTLEGIATPTPVLIVNGAQAGPTLCLTGAIHGDELNGIEIIRRVMYNLDPQELSGTVIGVPIVNLQGFHSSSRYLPDRRDLNRYFPGNPRGSSADRIAYSFFNEVVKHCDALVDIHTGSFQRTNLPQVRADLSVPKVLELTQSFGATVVLESQGTKGTLRRAAVEAGIPAATLEAGESMRLQEKSVKHGVNGINTLMSKMGMIERFRIWGDPEPVYYKSEWVRADHGGILLGHAKLGERVEKGELLGVVTDPITNVKSNIYSPYNGRIIGKALDQVVLPGFAAFHVAKESAKRAPPVAVESPAPGTDSVADARPAATASESSTDVELDTE